MLRRNSLTDRILNSIARTIDEWIATMSTRDFWAIFAVCATVVGFLIAAIIMLINFDVMRMRNCFDASDLNAYVMFNVLLFFTLDGLMAVGEAFTYFDNKRRGIPHKLGPLVWFFSATLGLGSGGLIMLKVAC